MSLFSQKFLCLYFIFPKKFPFSFFHIIFEKLIENQNFMVKPALLYVVESIVEVGGASMQYALSGLIRLMQEVL